MVKKFGLVLLALAFILVIAACGGQEENPAAEPDNSSNEQPSDSDTNSETPEPAPEPEPAEEVEITIRTGISEEDFDKRYRGFIEEKFPHVTLKRIGLDVDLQNLLISNPPDLIDEGFTNLLTWVDMDVPENLVPYIEKYDVDLNKFDQSVLNDIRSYSPDGELLQLPFTVQPFVLHYNKDIFDTFGVEYPQDGSTWDELIELAGGLARTSEGTSYRGLDAGLQINRMQTQLSLPYIDPETEKSVVASHDGWTRLYETYQKIYSVPGNFPEGTRYGDGRKAFLQAQNLAMYPHIIMLSDSDFNQAVEGGFRFGITSYPVFEDRPGIATGLFGGGMAISKGSENKDQAFQIALYLTSEEVQMELAKMGMVSPLVSEEVRSNLFADNPLAEDVNLDVLFQNRFADPFEKTQWDKKANGIANASLQAFITGEKDMNTTLREVDEQINQMIAESKE